MQVITIETDGAGAKHLREAAEQIPDAAFDTRRVQAQVGDPDTWMFVAQVLPGLVAGFAAAIMTLIRQRKIKYIKVGETEFRDITPEQVSEVMKALEGPSR